MAEVPQFHPYQIVCLEQAHGCLYCEVIQSVELRQLCWVRPLVLATLDKDNPVFEPMFAPKALVDVRLTSDLLYPLSLFRPALDTEVIPLLHQLETQDFASDSIAVARQQLRQFILQVWQDNPRDFRF